MWCTMHQQFAVHKQATLSSKLKGKKQCAALFQTVVHGFMVDEMTQKQSVMCQARVCAWHKNECTKGVLYAIVFCKFKT